MNSRDMEDFAIDGSQRCYEALERQGGGGEKGMRYVTLNRDAVAKQRGLQMADPINKATAGEGPRICHICKQPLHGRGLPHCSAVHDDADFRLTSAFVHRQRGARCAYPECGGECKECQ